jgi:hypothetical protein
MNRRDALKATTAMVGGVLVTSTGLLAACAPEPRQAAPGVLTLDDQALVAEIADTLLPTTAASPGAKAAGAGPAINLLLTDCYEPEAQQRVVRGLKEFRARCRDRYGDGFASLPRRARERLLREIDAEARGAEAAAALPPGAGTHYFGLVRELALRAYFSSEVGMTRALRYVQTPGRWEGCVPLAPGQPAWG